MNKQQYATLKKVDKWTKIHAKSDTAQFKKITHALNDLPTSTTITKAVQDAVNVTVNGKLVAITAHLTQQDEDMVQMKKELLENTNDIRPVKVVKRYLSDTNVAVIKVGAVAAAVWAIIKLWHIK